MPSPHEIRVARIRLENQRAELLRHRAGVQQRLATERERRDQLQERIQSAQRAIVALEAQRSACEAELRRLEPAATQISAQLADTERNLATVKADELGAARAR
jgi:chromosome segregation ATPase